MAPPRGTERRPRTLRLEHGDVLLRPTISADEVRSERRTVSVADAAEGRGFEDVPHGRTVRDSPWSRVDYPCDRLCDAGACLAALPLDSAVDRGSADAEELSGLGGAVVTAVDQRDQVRFLATVQLRLLPTEALAFATLIPSQVRSLIKSDSATMASTLSRSRPTAPVGSYRRRGSVSSDGLRRRRRNRTAG